MYNYYNYMTQKQTKKLKKYLAADMYKYKMSLSGNNINVRHTANAGKEYPMTEKTCSLPDK